MGENPNKIETEIEATRSRLTDEINLLSDKISPGRIAGRTADDARRAVVHARERVAGGVADPRLVAVTVTGVIVTVMAVVIILRHRAPR